MEALPIAKPVFEYYVTNGVLGITVLLLLGVCVLLVRWGLSLQAKLDKAHEDRLIWHLNFGQELSKEIEKRNAINASRR